MQPSTVIDTVLKIARDTQLSLPGAIDVGSRYFDAVRSAVLLALPRISIAEDVRLKCLLETASAFYPEETEELLMQTFQCASHALLNRAITSEATNRRDALKRIELLIEEADAFCDPDIAEGLRKIKTDFQAFTEIPSLAVAAD